MPRYAGIYLGVYFLASCRVAARAPRCRAAWRRPSSVPKASAPDARSRRGAWRARAVRFVPGDAHGDDLVVAAAQPAGTRAPGDRLDDELDGLEPPAVGLVAQVAHAHEPLTVALEEFLGSALARAQRESRFHE